MTTKETNNKRLAKNTLFLYVRMFFTMIIAIYTSRVILDVLGVDDYGIYNVVGGIASSLIFLSSTLSNATQRYLNYGIGSGNSIQLGQVFNMSVLIYAVFAIFAISFIEIGGRWMIFNKLLISQDRIDAALWILHSTSITLCVTLLSTVYESIIIARENMKVYAYIGIYDAIMKLVIVLIIGYISYDKLKMYAVLVTLVIVTERILPIYYAVKKYEETKIYYYWNRDRFLEMFKFAGWNFLGTVVFILNDQGINILLNMYFGPAVNAARALSVHIKQVVCNFATGFFTAVRPQIVKSYASGNIDYFLSLVFKSSKYTFFLLWIICLPVTIRIECLLAFWLKEVPDLTGQFVTWILIFSLVNSLCDPFWQAIQAIGKLKKYVLIGSFVYLMAFPFSWVAFNFGGNAVLTFQILAVIRLIYLMVVITIVKQYVSISIVLYIRSVIVPILIVVVVTVIPSIFVDKLIPESFIGTVISCVINFFIAILGITIGGVNKDEKYQIIQVIKKRACKK